MNWPNHRAFTCDLPPLASSPEGRGLDPDPSPDTVAESDPLLLLFPMSMLRIDGAGEPTLDVGRSGGVEGGVVVEDDL